MDHTNLDSSRESSLEATSDESSQASLLDLTRYMEGKMPSQSTDYFDNGEPNILNPAHHLQQKDTTIRQLRNLLRASNARCEALRRERDDLQKGGTYLHCWGTVLNENSGRKAKGTVSACHYMSSKVSVKQTKFKHSSHSSRVSCNSRNSDQ